jgi:hypothetical protein
LIVALTMQPMVAYAAERGCGSTNASCAGCGCCEVEATQRLCGCCQPAGGASTERAESSCTAAPQADSAGTLRVAAGHREHGVTSLPGRMARVLDGTMLRSCTCGKPVQPLEEHSSRRTSSDPRETLAMGTVAWSATVPVRSPVARNVAGQRDHMAVPHAAQIVLCIWRL